MHTGQGQMKVPGHLAHCFWQCRLHLLTLELLILQPVFSLGLVSVHNCITLGIACRTDDVSEIWYRTAFKSLFWQGPLLGWKEKGHASEKVRCFWRTNGWCASIFVNCDNHCCGQSIIYLPLRKRNMKFPSQNEQSSVGAIHQRLNVRKVMGRDL